MQLITWLCFRSLGQSLCPFTRRNRLDRKKKEKEGRREKEREEKTGRKEEEGGGEGEGEVEERTKGRNGNKKQLNFKKSAKTPGNICK